MRCKLEIAKNNYGDALELLNNVNNKLKPIYKKLRCEAIEGVLKGVLKDSERIRLCEELEAMRLELGSCDDIDFDLFV